MVNMPYRRRGGRGVFGAFAAMVATVADLLVVRLPPDESVVDLRDAMAWGGDSWVAVGQRAQT
jgi:hypothetical protein